MSTLADDTRCPKCGTGRLLRRYAYYQTLQGQRDVPLGLRLRCWLAGRRGRVQLTVRTYHCELCGHHWHIYDLSRRDRDAL